MPIHGMIIFQKITCPRLHARFFDLQGSGQGLLV